MLKINNVENGNQRVAKRARQTHYTSRGYTCRWISRNMSFYFSLLIENPQDPNCRLLARARARDL